MIEKVRVIATGENSDCLEHWGIKTPLT
jgi:hypothetical protein